MAFTYKDLYGNDKLNGGTLDLFIGHTTKYVIKPTSMPSDDLGTSVAFKVEEPSATASFEKLVDGTGYTISIITNAELVPDQALVITIGVDSVELPVRTRSLAENYISFGLDKKTTEKGTSLKVIAALKAETLEENLPSYFEVAIKRNDAPLETSYKTLAEIRALSIDTTQISTMSINVKDMRGADLTDALNASTVVTRETIKSVDTAQKAVVKKGETITVTLPVTPATLQDHAGEIVVTTTTNPGDELTFTYVAMVGGELTFTLSGAKIGTYTAGVNADGIQATVNIEVTKPDLVSATIANVTRSKNNTLEQIIPVTIAPLDADPTISSVTVIGGGNGIVVAKHTDGKSISISGAPSTAQVYKVEVMLGTVKATFDLNIVESIPDNIKGPETVLIEGLLPTVLDGLFSVYEGAVKLADPVTLEFTDARLERGDFGVKTKTVQHTPFTVQATAKDATGKITKSFVINYVPVNPTSVLPTDGVLNTSIQVGVNVDIPLTVLPAHYTESFTVQTSDPTSKIFAVGVKPNGNLTITGKLPGTGKVTFFKGGVLGSIDVVVTTKAASLVYVDPTDASVDTPLIHYARVEPASSASAIEVVPSDAYSILSVKSDVTKGTVRMILGFKEAGECTLTIRDTVSGKTSAARVQVAKTNLTDPRFEVPSVTMDTSSVKTIGFRSFSEIPEFVVDGADAPDIELIPELDIHGHRQIRLTSDEFESEGTITMIDKKGSVSIPFSVVAPTPPTV